MQQDLSDSFHSSRESRKTINNANWKGGKMAKKKEENSRKIFKKGGKYYEERLQLS